MNRARMLLTAAFTLLLPGPLCRPALRMLGHKIGAGVRIGLSVLMVERLWLQEGARIGHLNFVRTPRLAMRRGAYFGRLNVVHGPFSVSLDQDAAIGNSNKVVRGPRGAVTTRPAQLRLGVLSKLTAGHRIDCTASVTLGDYSTIAGTACEVWTHGYVHERTGPGRYRIDGPVRIGSNVYVGSASVITAGVHLADGVIVGAGTTVARSLLEPGCYVSAGVRRLDRPVNPDQRSDLHKVEAEGLCERVYEKRPGLDGA